MFELQASNLPPTSSIKTAEPEAVSVAVSEDASRLVLWGRRIGVVLLSLLICGVLESLSVIGDRIAGLLILGVIVLMFASELREGFFDWVAVRAVGKQIACVAFAVMLLFAVIAPERPPNRHEQDRSVVSNSPSGDAPGEANTDELQTKDGEEDREIVEQQDVAAVAEETSEQVAEPEPARSASSFSSDPQETPAPTTDPVDALKAVLVRRVGAEGLEVRVNDYYADPNKKIVLVRWKITERPSTLGPRYDLVRILRSVHESEIVLHEITAFGASTLIDRFGQESTEVLVKVSFRGSTVGKIAWSHKQIDHVIVDTVYEIADQVWFRPGFQPR